MPKRIDLLFGVGTRPSIIKLKPLVQAADKLKLSYTVRDTGQHTDPMMYAWQYQELEMEKPYIVSDFKATIEQLRPKIVVVIGDTNSTVQWAVAASQAGVRIAHVEAGCRCFQDIPEECNRKLVDRLATWNFAPTKSSLQNVLNKNGIFTGDVLYDAFKQYRPPPYAVPHTALVTIHRQENTTSGKQVLELLEEPVRRFDLVVFPVHPRVASLYIGDNQWPRNVLPIGPVTYKKMLYLISCVFHVYTDSGGVQREAYWSGVPTTVLRKAHEWPETMEPGNEEAFGDGKAALKIIHRLKEEL